MSYASEKRRIEREALARTSSAFAEELRERPESTAKAWAWRLKKREQAGEPLSEFAKAAWRQTLGEK